MNLRDATHPDFKHLLGCRVECRDQRGQRWVGVLQFAGVNELLHGKFQVTVGGTPVWPVDPKTIKEFKPFHSVEKK